jgi:hypothetical protein
MTFYPVFELENGRLRLMIHWGINSMQSIKDNIIDLFSSSPEDDTKVSKA